MHIIDLAVLNENILRRRETKRTDSAHLSCKILLRRGGAGVDLIIGEFYCSALSFGIIFIRS